MEQWNIEKLYGFRLDEGYFLDFSSKSIGFEREMEGESDLATNDRSQESNQCFPSNFVGCI